MPPGGTEQAPSVNNTTASPGWMVRSTVVYPGSSQIASAEPANERSEANHSAESLDGL